MFGININSLNIIEIEHQATEGNDLWETRNKWDELLHSSVYHQLTVSKAEHKMGNQSSAQRSLCNGINLESWSGKIPKIYRTKRESYTQKEISKDLSRISLKSSAECWSVNARGKVPLKRLEGQTPRVQTSLKITPFPTKTE